MQISALQKARSKCMFSKAKLQLHLSNEIIRLDVAQESRLLSLEEPTLRAHHKMRVLGLDVPERGRKKQTWCSLHLKEGDALPPKNQTPAGGKIISID